MAGVFERIRINFALLNASTNNIGVFLPSPDGIVPDIVVARDKGYEDDSDYYANEFASMHDYSIFPNQSQRLQDVQIYLGNYFQKARTRDDSEYINGHVMRHEVTHYAQIAYEREIFPTAFYDNHLIRLSNQDRSTFSDDQNSEYRRLQSESYKFILERRPYTEAAATVSGFGSTLGKEVSQSDEFMFMKYAADFLQTTYKDESWRRNVFDAVQNVQDAFSDQGASSKIVSKEYLTGIISRMMVILKRPDLLDEMISTEDTKLYSEQLVEDFVNIFSQVMIEPREYIKSYFTPQLDQEYCEMVKQNTRSRFEQISQMEKLFKA